MKSMMLTGINKMEMFDVADPVIKNDEDVLIKMKTIGVCGSDIHYYKSGKIGSQVVEYPFTVGHEGAGIVVTTGKGVSKVKKGDRIAIEPAMPCFQCDQCLQGRIHTCRKLKFLGCPGQAEGCLSEYIVMPESSCIPIPDSLSYDHAAISEPLSIGLYAAKKAGELSNKNIGILGFGPIGMSVLLSAKAAGVGNSYVTDLIHERLNIAIKSGASWTGNPESENIVESISEREALQLDVVFECCGKQEAVDQGIELLKPGGILLIVGIPEFENWSFPTDKLRRKEISILNVRRQLDCVEPSIELMEKGLVDISHMPTHRFDFSDTKKAFDLVSEYRDGVMKAMIDFS